MHDLGGDIHDLAEPPKDVRQNDNDRYAEQAGGARIYAVVLLTVIIRGGTPRLESTSNSSNSRLRLTESQRKSGTPAFYPSSCSQRTTNIMSVVDRNERKPLCSPDISPFLSQSSSKSAGDHSEENFACMKHLRHAAVVPTSCLV